MKSIFTYTIVFCAAALLVACGGTKNTVATAPVSHGEFDSSTGSWKPLTKVVTPPPREEGAVITAQNGPGMMDKASSTLKKPLKWVGLAKDEPQPAPVPATITKKKKAAQ